MQLADAGTIGRGGYTALKIGMAQFGWRWNPWSVVAGLLAAAAAAVPYFIAHGFVVGVALERGFALVCHQRPERSFWILGAPVAVCARCLGIYLGAAIGLLLRTSRRVAMSWLMIAAAINALDAVTELAGLHGNWMLARFALGVALGAAGGILIASAVASLPPAEAGSESTIGALIGTTKVVP